MINRLRRWAEKSHTVHGRYSPVGIAFHWSMAALITFQLWWGWRTARLPVGADKLQAYDLHFQVGLVILLLTFLRMAWRLIVPGPQNDADKPGWESVAAHLTHLALYACFLVLPLSGWLMVSATARETPIRFLGLSWPHLPLADLTLGRRFQIEDWAGVAHSYVALGLGLLVVVHIGAALKHHLWDQDDVLAAMVPGVDPPEESADESPTPAGSAAR